MTINEEQRTWKEAMVAFFFYDTSPWFGLGNIKHGEEKRSIKNSTACDLNRIPDPLIKKSAPEQSLSTFSIKRMKQIINISKTVTFVVHTFYLRKFLMSKISRKKTPQVMARSPGM